MKLTTVSGQLDRSWIDFIVCDYFKSEMSEYDGSYVYVPLDYLQHLRGTEGRTNLIQIRLNHYDTQSAEVDRDTIQQLFPAYTCRWRPGRTSRGPCSERSPSNAAS